MTQVIHQGDNLGPRTVWALLLLLTPGFASTAPDESREMPSLEMLEYLGEWESSDGQWIDPMTAFDNERSNPQPEDFRWNENRDHE